MEKDKIQKEIKETENKLSKLKLQLENDSINGKLLDVPELGLEIEIEVTHKGKSYDKIMAIPEVQEKMKNGWRLLYAIRPEDYVNEVGFLENNPTYSKVLKMDGSSTKDDFFISQMFKRNKANGYVAGFFANSDFSVLNSDGDSDDSNSYLGVRFARKKNFKVGKK